MFPIDNYRSINTDIPIITDNYIVLLSDVYPILFSGTNVYGNRLLGSSVDEDYDNNIERFFVVVIRDKMYIDFINNSITYLDILKQSKPIFVIDKVMDSDCVEIFGLDFHDIPEDYLPSELSFCPEFNLPASLMFPVRLKGGLADSQKGTPRVIANVGVWMYHIFYSAASLMRNIYKADVLMTPNTAGSFQLNYVIDFQNDQKDLLVDDSAYGEFIRSYVKYCIDELPNEVGMLLEIEKGEPEEFYKLLGKYNDIQNAGTERQKANNEQKLTSAVLYCFKKIRDISNTIGQNHSELMLETRINGKEYSIAMLDLKSKENMAKRKNEIDIGINRIKKKGVPKKYILRIISLNVETRKGIASIKMGERRKRRNRRIIIMGEKKLENTRYIDSMNNTVDIEVKAYPTIENERFFRIEIIDE